jgi:hypothetical protein
MVATKQINLGSLFMFFIFNIGTNVPGIATVAGFAGFVTIHRYKSPRVAANAKLPPSPAIVGYTMLYAVFFIRQYCQSFIDSSSCPPNPNSTIF